MSSQDSRKDPRSKILNLTVRYKSATVAEFVEDYSYDISRGGLFIKTANPFPTGTLLKFEVRIGEEQKVIDGVGRVTWRRERPQGAGKPAGMGIKFIRIADECVQLIQNAVDQHSGAEGQFEEGAREQGVFLSEPPANLRSPDTTNDEPRANPVPRMFPDNKPTPGSELDDPSDQSMLFQSTELLKTAMSKVTPLGEAGDAGQPERQRSEAHPTVEDRVTLPTGASRIPPAAVAVETKQGTPAAAIGVSHEETADDEAAPDSSEEVTRQFVPDEHHPVLAAQSSRSKPPSRRKNPKKKKKKFNYTSLPAPKHSKPPAAVSEATPTAPPRPNEDSNIRRASPSPAQAGSSKGWLVALGLLVVGALAFIAFNTRDDDARLDPEPAVTPAVSAVASPTPVPPEPAPSTNTSPVPLTDVALASPSANVSLATSVSSTASSAAALNEPETPPPSPAEEPAKAARETPAPSAEEQADPAPAKPRPRTRRRAAKKPPPEVNGSPDVNAVVSPSTTPTPPPSPVTGATEASVKPGDVTPAPEPRPAPSPAPAPQPAPAPVPPAPVPPPPAPPAPVPPAPAPPTPTPPTPAQ